MALPTRAFQSTFQVTLPDAPKAPYHARRTHKKSRNGCVVCKSRRVKCDERKPSCLRCENYGASCLYPPSPTSSRTSSSPGSTPSPPDRTLASLSAGDMVRNVRDAISDDLAFAPRVIGDHNTVVNIAVNSFQFFLQSSANMVGTPSIQQVMRREMIHVAFDNPYLLYTIAGCGILHMNRMCENSNESRNLAEAFFWQRALSLYSRELHKPVDEKNVNGLISACMLMGITSLIPPKFEIQDSWVFTGRPSDLNWLAVQGGLAYILKIAGKYVPGSIWGVPFHYSYRQECKLFKYEIKRGREGLHSGLADLCEIDDETTAESSPYWYQIKLLSPYLELEANEQNAALCATWMGRIDPQFVNLCRERDPRALVILVYWMGLMCSLSQWQQWVEGRLRQECIAVCIYLESLWDPAIRPFLDFPATAAGYTLLDSL
ncbi:hypothetical protein BDW62DRAFT_172996 [Aspergillus aurantiobrunneus]